MTWNGAGSTRAWRRFRVRILDRDGWTCQLQYADMCLGRANQVHHTQPWEGRPEDADPATCIAACFPCNHHAGEPTDPDPEPKAWNP